MKLKELLAKLRSLLADELVDRLVTRVIVILITVLVTTVFPSPESTCVDLSDGQHFCVGGRQQS